MSKGEAYFALHSIVVPMSAFVKMTIARLIKFGRNNKKFTQGQLAKMTGYSRRHIQQLESGNVPESMLKSFKLFRAIGLINDTSANEADTEK